MEIAKMFATLGFKVDSSGLATFKAGLESAKPSVTQFSTSVRNLGNQLNTLGDKLIRVKKVVNIADSFKESPVKKLNHALGSINNALVGISGKEPATRSSLVKLHQTLRTGTPIWAKYATEVGRAKTEIASAIASINQLRAAAAARINVNTRINNGGSGGTGYGSGGGSFGGGGNSNGSWLGAGGQQFFRSMLPTALISTGLASAGYSLQEIVQRGREQTRMESKLLFASSGKGDSLQADYKDSLDFVRSTGLRLGIDSSELGAAFAQVNQSSGGVLSKDERKAMFTDMSEFIMTVGADKTDQKLIMKAVNQMFSLGRIMAEEMNQLTERGIPRKMIYDVAKDSYGYKTNAEVIDAQKKGLLKGEDILPEVFKRFAAMAHDSGAFAKMQQSSGFKQNQASEAFNQASKVIMDAGLDAALASMFSLLTKIATFIKDTVVPAFVSLTTPIRELATTLEWFIGLLSLGFEMKSQGFQNTVYATIIALVAYKLGLVSLIYAGYAYIKVSIVMRASNLALAKSFAILALRMAIIIGGLWFLYEASVAWNRKMQGEVTWLDLWGIKFQIMYAKIDLFFEKAKLKFLEMRLWWQNYDLTESLGIDEALNKLDNMIPDFLKSKVGINASINSQAPQPVNYQQPRMNAMSTNFGKISVDILRDGKLTKTYDLDSGNIDYLSLDLEG